VVVRADPEAARKGRLVSVRAENGAVMTRREALKAVAATVAAPAALVRGIEGDRAPQAVDIAVLLYADLILIRIYPALNL